jgi:hypothetical protein
MIFTGVKPGALDLTDQCDVPCLRRRMSRGRVPGPRVRALMKLQAGIISSVTVIAPAARVFSALSGVNYAKPSLPFSGGLR